MSIDLSVVQRSETADDQESPVACSLLDLVKCALRHTRKFVDAPRAT